MNLNVERAASLGGPHVEVLKVSSKSNPNACAGALAGVLRQEGAVEVQVVGAGALNQAIKAVAIARGFVVPSGIDLICIPTFADIEIDGENRTAIRLLLEDRQRRSPLSLDMRPMDLDGKLVDGAAMVDGAALVDGTGLVETARGNGAAASASADVDVDVVDGASVDGERAAGPLVGTHTAVAAD